MKDEIIFDMKDLLKVKKLRKQKKDDFETEIIPLYDEKEEDIKIIYDEEVVNEK